MKTRGKQVLGGSRLKWPICGIFESLIQECLYDTYEEAIRFGLATAIVDEKNFSALVRKSA